MNRFVWDMSYPDARELRPDGPLVSAELSRAEAPVAPPGRYGARLSVGGQQYEGSFEIRKNPRITATDDDLRAQFEFMVQIRDRLSEVTDAVERLRKARQRLEERERGAGGDAAVAQAVASAKEKLRAIESILTRAIGPNLAFNLPPKGLNDRLAALTGPVGQADSRPARQMYAVFEDLSAQVAEQFRLLDQVLAKEVTAIIGQGEGDPAGTAARR